jgi:hypothetical protein
MNNDGIELMKDVINSDLSARVIVSYFYKGRFLKHAKVVNALVGDRITITIDGATIE